MTSQTPNAQPSGPGTPRPNGLQVTVARSEIYARRHPVGYAVRGAALAAAATVCLAVVAASPSLADPTNVPGWTLVAVLVAALIGAFLVGLPMYFHGRNLPRVEETDPVRYATAKAQAATGELGGDEEINRLARELADRLVHTSSPAYYMGGLFILVVFAGLLPIADVVGPGFEPRNLLQTIPSVAFLVAIGIVYLSAKTQNDRYRSFRAAYDADGSEGF